MKLVYPIILYPMEEHEGGYTVEMPDLPGCVTEGHDLADALDMARDAASGWILDEMEDGRAVPHASNITDVKPDEPDASSASSRWIWTPMPRSTAARRCART